jgi:hypothetical protein
VVGTQFAGQTGVGPTLTEGSGFRISTKNFAASSLHHSLHHSLHRLHFSPGRSLSVLVRSSSLPKNVSRFFAWFCDHSSLPGVSSHAKSSLSRFPIAVSRVPLPTGEGRTMTIHCLVSVWLSVSTAPRHVVPLGGAMVSCHRCLAIVGCPCGVPWS